MKRLLALCCWLLVVGIGWLVFLPSEAKAFYSCSDVGISISVNPGIAREENAFTVTFDPAAAAGKIDLTREKGICLSCTLADDCLTIGTPSQSGYQLNFTMSGDKCSVNQVGNHYIVIKDVGTGSTECKKDNAYKIEFPSCDESTTTIDKAAIPLGQQTVKITFVGWGNFVNDVSFFLVKNGQVLPEMLGKRREGDNIVIDLSRNFKEIGWYWVRLEIPGMAPCNSKQFEVVGAGVTPTPRPTGPIPTGAAITDPCWDPEKKEAVPACVACLGGSSGYDENRPNLAAKSWTALGCIPNDPREFVAWLLARAIGIGGGIAFLLMIWGGFQIITSTGDPDRLNAGKEVMTSAIAGLLLIIFSLFLLQLIGVDILGLGQVGFQIGQ